jgi:hypothetical protein
MNHLCKPCIKYGKKQSIGTLIHIGRSFKFILEVGVEESIVNAPHVSVQSKTQTTQKVRLDLNSRSVICNL